MYKKLEKVKEQLRGVKKQVEGLLGLLEEFEEEDLPPIKVVKGWRGLRELMKVTEWESIDEYMRYYALKPEDVEKLWFIIDEVELPFEFRPNIWITVFNEVGGRGYFERVKAMRDPKDPEVAYIRGEDIGI